MNNMTDAAYRNAVAEATAPSKSLGRGRFQLIQAKMKRSPIGIDHGVRPAAFDLLVGVKAARTAT